MKVWMLGGIGLAIALGAALLPGDAAYAQYIVTRDMTDEDGEVRPYVRFLDKEGDVVVEHGYFDVERKWPSSSDGTTNVPVCWSNSTDAVAREMAWVRQAVEATWQRHSRLRFTHWGKCAAGSEGINITIADEGPHTKGLGTTLHRRPNGMVLNFTFSAWTEGRRCGSSAAFRERCIRWLAVHEFGHAIGFAHEHNRDDRSPTCRIAPQGPSAGAVKLTDYDADSVMNYCNVQNYQNDGTLSRRDIASVQRMYGAAQ